MKTPQDAVKALPLYDLLTEKEKVLFLQDLQVYTYDEDHHLFGKECFELPLVLKGSMRLYTVSEEGREMTIYHIKEGEICSLSSICLTQYIEHDYHVEIKKGSVIASISSDLFQTLFQNNFAFNNYIYKALALKLLETIHQLSEKTFTRLSDRLMAYLLKAANEKGEIRVSHYDIAVELGSAREVISRTLKKLEKEGTVTLKKNLILLNQPPLKK